jgi:hypothetical protein
LFNPPIPPVAELVAAYRLADANNALIRMVHKVISLRGIEFLQRVQSTDANFSLRTHRIVPDKTSLKLVSTGITTRKRQRHRQR